MSVIPTEKAVDKNHVPADVCAVQNRHHIPRLIVDPLANENNKPAAFHQLYQHQHRNINISNGDDISLVTEAEFQEFDKKSSDTENDAFDHHVELGALVEEEKEVSKRKREVAHIVRGFHTSFEKSKRQRAVDGGTNAASRYSGPANPLRGHSGNAVPARTFNDGNVAVFDLLVDAFNLGDLSEMATVLCRICSSNVRFTSASLSSQASYGIRPILFFWGLIHEIYPDAILLVLRTRIKAVEKDFSSSSECSEQKPSKKRRRRVNRVGNRSYNRCEAPALFALSAAASGFLSSASSLSDRSSLKQEKIRVGGDDGRSNCCTDGNESSRPTERGANDTSGETVCSGDSDQKSEDVQSLLELVFKISGTRVLKPLTPEQFHAHFDLDQMYSKSRIPSCNRSRVGTEVTGSTSGSESARSECTNPAVAAQEVIQQLACYGGITEGCKADTQHFISEVTVSFDRNNLISAWSHQVIASSRAGASNEIL